MGWKRDERKEIKEKEREEGIEIRMEGGEDNEEEVKKKTTAKEGNSRMMEGGRKDRRRRSKHEAMAAVALNKFRIFVYLFFSVINI